MAFLKRIRMAIMFMLLRFYSADSNMEDSHFSHNHASLKKLIEPLSYVVFVQLPFIEYDPIFYGGTTYCFVIENPTRKIDLNANGLAIIGTSGLFRYPYKNFYDYKTYHYSNETETLIFEFETDIPSGVYEMSLKYTGNISGKEIGVYRTFCKDCNGVSKWIFMTQFKPTAARRVFPCWDEPSLKARFAIEIMHHRNYTVLSNMPMKSQNNITMFDDMMWTFFHPTPPIPTYLVAFSLTDFTCYGIKEDVFTTRVCCRPLVKHQIIFALNTSVDVMSYLQWYMDMSPQLSEITSIGLSDFPNNATGNWGLNIYREGLLEYNETLHPIDHKFDVSVYVASMIALQWFGNLVSPTSWTHMWFFQTLALFYGAKAAAETYPVDIKFMFTYWLQSLAREDNAISKLHPGTYEVNNQDEMDRLIRSYHFSNCLKEYAIMVMLEYAVTENIFRNAAMKYLEEHRFSFATPNGFWEAIQDDEGVQRRLYHHSTSIVEIVHSWLKQRSLPVIYVTRDKSEHFIFGEKYTNIKKDIDNTDNLLIPINYVTKSHPASFSRINWLHQYEYILTDIPISDWVIVNWQHAGYYRVSYDALTWETLTSYLFSEDYATIHVLSRAHIIEDAHYFWSQQKLSMSRFIGLIKYMEREEQCAPWYAMQKVLQKMWTFLNIKAGRDFKRRMLVSLNLLLEEVGYTEHPNDVECVKFKRLLATKWACRLFHEGCLEIAKQRLIEHLDHPETHIIPPTWEEWTYCNGLVRSDMDTWALVFKEFRETKNMRILEYLGCSRDSSVILDYLKLIMSTDSFILSSFGLNVTDSQKIYRSIVRKYVRDDEVLGNVTQNLLLMEFKNEPLVERLSYIIENVYSLTQMEKISSLLERHNDTKRAVYRILTLKIQHQYLQIHELEKLKN